MGCKITTYCAHNQIISSLGVSTKETYAAIENYQTNIGKFFDGTPVDLINKASLDVVGLEHYTFAEQLSILTLSDVIKQSGIKLNNSRTLLILSTTKGNIDYLNTDFKKTFLWSMAKSITNHFQSYHQALIVSNACISGVSALVTGSRLIQNGEYDNVYVLGIDVISEFIVSGFKSFKSLSSTNCRPYDNSHDGLTIGEGCGVLLLTNNRDLSDNKIILSGGGISDDANHISGPSRTGDGLFFAIDIAMKQAGVSAEDIGYVNTHGTGTPYNDEMESKALNLATLTDTPCNSLKPFLGHTLGAAGVIETILAVEQLQHNFIFGTLGYETNGVPYELNISEKHRKSELSHCLKTVSGFGGTNAAVVLSKESDKKTKPKTKHISKITEVAHILIEKQIDKSFAEYIREEYKNLGSPYLKFFKMDNLAKLTYISSCKLLKNVELSYPKNRLGIVVCNSSSSLDTDIKHQEIVNKHLPEGASPAVFVYTLANVAPAEIAIKHKFQGEFSVFINENKDLDFVSKYAYLLIENNICDAVVYGWSDFLKEEYNSELFLIEKE